MQPSNTQEQPLGTQAISITQNQDHSLSLHPNQPIHSNANPNYNYNTNPNVYQMNSNTNYKGSSEAFNFSKGNPFNSNPSPQMPYQYSTQMNQVNEPTLNMMQKNLLYQQMTKNIKASGQVIVIILCLISVVVGELIKDEGGNRVSDTVKEIYKQFYNTNLETDIVFSFLKSLGKNCETFILGIFALPYLSMVCFVIPNFIGMILACCGVTCFGYFQIVLTLFFGYLTAMTSGANCDSIFTRIITLPASSANSYAKLAVLSLLSVVANFYWMFSKKRAEREKSQLSLLLAT